MSVRSKSTLGGLGKSSVIVYYTQTAGFKKLSRDDVPGRFMAGLSTEGNSLLSF
jgi:hypothetical protein